MTRTTANWVRGACIGITVFVLTDSLVAVFVAIVALATAFYVTDRLAEDGHD